MEDLAQFLIDVSRDRVGKVESKHNPKILFFNNCWKHCDLGTYFIVSFKTFGDTASKIHESFQDANFECY